MCFYWIYLLNIEKIIRKKNSRGLLRNIWWKDTLFFLIYSIAVCHALRFELVLPLEMHLNKYNNYDFVRCMYQLIIAFCCARLIGTTYNVEFLYLRLLRFFTSEAVLKGWWWGTFASSKAISKNSGDGLGLCLEILLIKKHAQHLRNF